MTRTTTLVWIAAMAVAACDALSTPGAFVATRQPRRTSSYSRSSGRRSSRRLDATPNDMDSEEVAAVADAEPGPVAAEPANGDMEPESLSTFEYVVGKPGEFERDLKGD